MKRRALTIAVCTGVLTIFQPRVYIQDLIHSRSYAIAYAAAWLAAVCGLAQFQSFKASRRKGPAHARKGFHSPPLWAQVAIIVCLLFFGLFAMYEDHYFVMGFIVRSSILYRWVVPTLSFELFIFVFVRVLVIKAVKWTPLSPELAALSRREFRTAAEVVTILDLLLVSYPHGVARLYLLIALYVASTIVLGNFLSVHHMIRKHLDAHPEISLESQVKRAIHKWLDASVGATLTKSVETAIRQLSRFLRLMLPIVTAMTLCLTATAFSQSNPSAQLVQLSVRMPSVAPPPAQYTLGPYGYAAVCGNLPFQQPGFNVAPTLSQPFKDIWFGAEEGVGAGFAGCWSQPEVIHVPHGDTVAYDFGALNNRAVSLSIVTSAGEKEIYLLDGGRLSLVEGLLKHGELITGTPRFTLFNGDAQLVYTKYGTVTSLREEKHPTNQPNTSTLATTLNESQTVAWALAMEKTSEMLWPTRLFNRSGCIGEIALAPTYGGVVATLCSIGNNLRVGTGNETRISFTGSYSREKSVLLLAKNQKYAVNQILELAENP